ncbi:Anaerobic ribonucleoside-triphosphate reductase [compost metagenome]
MGCRSFLGVYEENGEQIHDGRNNIGVISLNLPRIALESEGDEGRFWVLTTQDSRFVIATFKRGNGRKSFKRFKEIPGIVV